MRKRTNIKNDIFNQSLVNDRNTYIFYLDRLTELAISIFEWENLPDTVDARFLEFILFRNGRAVFFEDEVLGYLTLETAVNGSFDVYRNPIKNRAYAINGYQKDLDINDSVIIYDNYLRLTNGWRNIHLYAQKLADLDMTILINAKSQKTPLLIECEENQRLTMLNLYKEYDGNAPVIFGNKGLNTEGVKVLSTNAPYVGSELYELKTNIWNEALTYLGIPNISQSKKERLITDEVKRMQGGSIASRYSRLNARKQACDKINEMFGLDIDVRYREDIDNPVDETVTTQTILKPMQ